MSNRNVDTDALRFAEKALAVYMAEVQENIEKMKDAAIDCSDNMGSDVYSQKAIDKLVTCIKQLNSAIEEAEALKNAINKTIIEIEDSAN